MGVGVFWGRPVCEGRTNVLGGGAVRHEGVGVGSACHGSDW